MARNSKMGAAFATDYGLYARIVDIWRKPLKVNHDGDVAEDEAAAKCVPVAINDIAWECGISAGKAAITMKYAVQQGWFRRTTPRTDQAAYEPTEKALKQFPDGPQVMPDPEPVRLESGATITADSESDARSWKTDPEYVELTDPRQADALRRRVKQSKLPPGEKPALPEGE